MIILHLWPEMVLIFLHCLSFRILYANQLTIAVIFESRFGFIGRYYATYPNQGMVSIGGNQGRRQSFIQIIYINNERLPQEPSGLWASQVSIVRSLGIS